MIFCASINCFMQCNDALLYVFPNRIWNQHNNDSHLLYLLFSLRIYYNFSKIKLSIYFWGTVFYWTYNIYSIHKNTSIKAVRFKNCIYYDKNCLDNITFIKFLKLYFSSKISSKISKNLIWLPQSIKISQKVSKNFQIFS